MYKLGRNSLTGRIANCHIWQSQLCWMGYGEEELLSSSSFYQMSKSTNQNPWCPCRREILTPSANKESKELYCVPHYLVMHELLQAKKLSQLENSTDRKVKMFEVITSVSSLAVNTGKCYFWVFWFLVQFLPSDAFGICWKGSIDANITNLSVLHPISQLWDRALGLCTAWGADPCWGDAMVCQEPLSSQCLWQSWLQERNQPHSCHSSDPSVIYFLLHYALWVLCHFALLVPAFFPPLLLPSTCINYLLVTPTIWASSFQH